MRPRYGCPVPAGPRPPLPAAGPRPPLPPGFGLALDAGVRRLDGGTVLVGGSPLRVLRLSAAGAAALDRLVAGEPVGDEPAVGALGRRLVDAGLAHPVPPARPGAAPAVSVVVPVRDDPGGLRRLLAGLRGTPGIEAVVVVDDGSGPGTRPDVGTGGTPPVHLVRHDRPRGPAAARDAGAVATATPLVAFVDADVTVAGGWLAPLVAHFEDPLVGAVAPRVVASTPSTPSTAEQGSHPALAAYEAFRSPLDLGPRPALVRPGGPVPYVPTAALVVRRSALEQIGGFDHELQRGEDVDLVWRLHEAGWAVRYEPAVRVGHAVRPSLGAWLRQRVGYGTSAAPLSRRHPGALAPVRVARPSAAAWVALSGGWPTGAAALVVASTAALAPKLSGLRHPWVEAVRLAGGGHLAAGAALAAAARREWWPLAAVAAGSRRWRAAAVVAVVGVPLWRWLRVRPDLPAGQWVALHVLDDAAYGAGVWLGCLRHRTAAPLRPDLAPWPGRRAAVERAPC